MPPRLPAPPRRRSIDRASCACCSRRRRAGGHFIEFLKIAKQTSTESYFQITRRITATKGLAGTLDGFVPWGMIQAVAKGAVFAWGQAASASALNDIEWMTKEQKTVASGGMGGFVQGIVLSPLLLLKTRVMTDPAFRSTGGLLATASASARVCTIGHDNAAAAACAARPAPPSACTARCGGAPHRVWRRRDTDDSGVRCRCTVPPRPSRARRWAAASSQRRAWAR